MTDIKWTGYYALHIGKTEENQLRLISMSVEQTKNKEPKFTDCYPNILVHFLRAKLSVMEIIINTAQQDLVKVIYRFE